MDWARSRMDAIEACLERLQSLCAQLEREDKGSLTQRLELIRIWSDHHLAPPHKAAILDLLRQIEADVRMRAQTSPV